MVSAAFIAAFVIGASPTGAARVACASDLPVYGYLQAPSTPPEVREPIWPLDAVVDPTEGGVRVDVLEAARSAHPDIDGDGQPDEIVSDGDNLIIQSHDKVDQLVITEPGLSVSVATPTPYFDLDGDGRDELYILARDSATAADRFFIVPGSVGFGRVTASEAAISVPKDFIVGVGDQLGTGGDDLYSAAGLVDGQSVLAVSAGGEVVAYELASGSLVDGYLAGSADLGSPAPALVFVNGTDGSTKVTVWSSAGSFELSLPPAAAITELQSVATWETEDGPLLEMSSSTRDGTTVYLWAVDSSCFAGAGPESILPLTETPTSLIATESEAASAGSATQSEVTQSSALPEILVDGSDANWTRIAIGSVLAVAVVAVVALSFRSRPGQA